MEVVVVMVMVVVVAVSAAAAAAATAAAAVVTKSFRSRGLFLVPSQDTMFIIELHNMPNTCIP
jgi:hypothetical protein